MLSRQYSSARFMNLHFHPIFGFDGNQGKVIEEIIADAGKHMQLRYPTVIPDDKVLDYSLRDGQTVIAQISCAVVDDMKCFVFNVEAMSMPEEYVADSLGAAVIRYNCRMI